MTSSGNLGAFLLSVDVWYCETYFGLKHLLHSGQYKVGDPRRLQHTRLSTCYHPFHPAATSAIAIRAFVHRGMDIVLLGLQACTAGAPYDQSLLAGKSQLLNSPSEVAGWLM